MPIAQAIEKRCNRVNSRLREGVLIRLQNARESPKQIKWEMICRGAVAHSPLQRTDLKVCMAQKALVILGSQWGDEGKGKIVDLLAEKVDLVCRTGGGSNAGTGFAFRFPQSPLTVTPRRKCAEMKPSRLSGGQMMPIPELTFPCLCPPYPTIFGRNLAQATPL